jgi:hypothetical protein
MFLLVFIQGDFLVRHIKSKNLFLDRYRSILNYGCSDRQDNRLAYVDRLDRIRTILSLTNDDAMAFLVGLPTNNAESEQDFT